MVTQVVARSLRLWRWLLTHPWLLLALFLVVLLLLGLLSLLADAVPPPLRQRGDAALRLAVQRVTMPAVDTGMRVVSRLGYAWGVVPLAITILLGLGLRQRGADRLFFRVAVGGAALLHQVAAFMFSRELPTLWPSLAPTPPFRFPSVQALSSMALVTAVVVLVWPTRWRVAALSAGGMFTLLVGLARLYLGVQDVADVVAGWAAALAWVLGVSRILYGRLGKPASAPPDAPPATVALVSGASRTDE